MSGHPAFTTWNIVTQAWLSPTGGTASWAGAFAEKSGNGGKKMWLALASVTLAAAIGFNVLALVIQELKR